MPAFFIVGSARSGTTMLRLMMAAHREVAVPPESRFIVELWRGKPVVEVEPFLDELSRYRLFRTWKLPIEEVSARLDRPRATYAEAIDAAYEAYARRRGKIRWGDKTPRYIEHIPFLAGLFPAARFIHLVRDGRSVALSYAGVPYGPKTVARAANLWAKRVRRGLAAREILSPDRYLQLRYEELVAGQEGQERQARVMCEFLGLDYDPSMLDYSEVARSEILGKSRLRNPYIVRRPTGDARSWKTQMPPRQVEMFEAVAGDVLSELGYDRRFPSPRRGARIRATLALGGVPLGRLPRTPRAETDDEAPDDDEPRPSPEGSEP